MSNKCFYFQTYDPMSLFCNCYIISPYYVIDWIMLWILSSSANASARQQGWHLLVKREREREREPDWRTRRGERLWCKNGGKHWTRGEVRLFNWLDSFLTFVNLNYRNHISLLEPSQLDSNLVDPVKEDLLAGRLASPQLKWKLPKLGNLLSRLL